LASLRAWSLRRRILAAGVAIAAFVVTGLASDFLSISGTGISLQEPWWAYPAAAAGAGLAGLIVASYIETAIGADATLCDTRWPVLGLVAIYFATDLRSAEPLLTGLTRPAVAVAALSLLTWALLERLRSERRAVKALAIDPNGTADGESCTTCRPLFPRHSATGHGAGRNDTSGQAS
jgi:hypothetical protein